MGCAQSQPTGDTKVGVVQEAAKKAPAQTYGPYKQEGAEEQDIVSGPTCHYP